MYVCMDSTSTVLYGFYLMFWIQSADDSSRKRRSSNFDTNAETKIKSNWSKVLESRKWKIFLSDPFLPMSNGLCTPGRPSTVRLSRIATEPSSCSIWLSFFSHGSVSEPGGVPRSALEKRICTFWLATPRSLANTEGSAGYGDTPLATRVLYEQTKRVLEGYCKFRWATVVQKFHRWISVPKLRKSWAFNVQQKKIIWSKTKFGIRLRTHII